MWKFVVEVFHLVYVASRRRLGWIVGQYAFMVEVFFVVVFLKVAYFLHSFYFWVQYLKGEDSHAFLIWQGHELYNIPNLILISIFVPSYMTHRCCLYAVVQFDLGVKKTYCPFPSTDAKTRVSVPGSKNAQEGSNPVLCGQQVQLVHQPCMQPCAKSMIWTVATLSWALPSLFFINHWFYDQADCFFAIVVAINHCVNISIIIIPYHIKQVFWVEN